jgi:hypothetical protein
MPARRHRVSTCHLLFTFLLFPFTRLAPARGKRLPPDHWRVTIPPEGESHIGGCQMKMGNRFSVQTWLAALAAVCVSLAVPSNAQIVTGEVAVGNTAATGYAPSQVFLDAFQFSKSAAINTAACPNVNTGPLSHDMCGQIQAAICAAPAAASPAPRNGVTIDARGFLPSPPNNTISCGSNPFASPTDQSGGTLTTTPVTLLLPGQTISAFKTWFLPTQSKTIGQNQNVTIIQWAGAAQGSTNCTVGTGTQTCVPVVCMGKPDPTTHNCDTPGEFANTPRTQISGLKIDCNNVAHMFGLVDITAQEQSWFQNGGVENCPGARRFHRAHRPAQRWHYERSSASR